MLPKVAVCKKLHREKKIENLRKRFVMHFLCKKCNGVEL